jgi:hypothetical protein
MKRKRLAVLAVLVLAAFAAGAQSNQVLDAILEQESTTFQQAAYLVLTAAGRIPDDTPLAQAAEALQQQGWKVRPRSAEEPLSLGEYCFVLMQAFELKGGLMYHIFPGRRYAGRELAYLGLIKGNTSPYRTFSGEEAVGILGRLMEWREERS